MEDNLKKVACDAGCGVGSLAIPMASKFKKVFASDISASMVGEATTRAKSGAIKNVEFKVNDLENLQGKYDTVSCIDVMIHYPTDKVTTASLYALTCPHASGLPREITYDYLYRWLI